MLIGDFADIDTNLVRLNLQYRETYHRLSVMHCFMFKSGRPGKRNVLYNNKKGQ